MKNLLHAKIHFILHARSIRNNWRQKFFEILDGLNIKPEISKTAVFYAIDLTYDFGNELSKYRVLAQLTKFNLKVKQLHPDAYVIECTAKCGWITCGNYLLGILFILFTALALFCNIAFGAFAIISLLLLFFFRFLCVYLNKAWLRSLISEVVIEQGAG
jgi:hypothetical protein